jgi:hypothetical protein
MVRILAAWLLLIGSAAAQERVDVQSRPGVTQSVFITAVANPNASVLLFPGGGGVYAQSRNNFLLRIAPQFTAAGMMVAVFDTPSGHPKWHGAVIPCVYATCRGYCGHSGVAEEQDICAAVVGWDQQWLDIGGRGGGCRRPPRVAGAVLTSSVWLGGMMITPLNQIRVPILVVHNRDGGTDGASQSEGTAHRVGRLVAE